MTQRRNFARVEDERLSKVPPEVHESHDRHTKDESAVASPCDKHTLGNSDMIGEAIRLLFFDTRYVHSDLVLNEGEVGRDGLGGPSNTYRLRWDSRFVSFAVMVSSRGSRLFD